MKISLALVFSFVSILTSAQNYFSNINYFNHRQSEIDVDHFNDIWLTSADINDDDIEGLLNRANEKMEMGYYAEALTDLDKAIAVDSSIAYLYNLRGICVLGTDSVDLAMQDFYHAASLDSSDALSRFYIGLMLVEMEQIDSAETILKSFNKNFSDYAIIKYSLANLYLAEGKTEKAIRFYKRAADIDPEFPEAWYSIGLIKLIMFDIYSARRFFNKTVKFNPEYAPAHYMIGLLELFENDLKSTMAAWNKALTIEPDNSYYRISRGILRMYSSDYHNGLEDLKKVYQESEDGVKAFQDFSTDFTGKAKIDFQTQLYFFLQYENKLAQAEITIFEEYLGKFLMKEYRQADDLLERAAVRFDDNALLHFFRGINAEHLFNQSENAETYYEKALARDPFIYAAHLRLGIIQSDLHKYGKSVESFNRFLEHNDTSEIVYRHRGIAYIRLGEYQLALDDFDNFFSIDSFDMDLEYNKALCYRMLGNYEQAIKQYSLVIGYDSTDNEARYQKAECHYKLSEYDSTLIELNQISAFFYAIRPETYILRAKIRFLNRNYSTAIYDINQALIKDPNNLDYMFLSSKLQRAQHNYTGLIDTYDRMLAIADELPEIHYLRAMIYFQMGDLENGCAGLADAEAQGHEQATKAKSIYCQTNTN